MSQVTTAELDLRAAERPGTLKLTVASVLDKIVFVSLLGLIVLTAIPYGSSQPWWKAWFVCLVFSLAVLALIEALLKGVARNESGVTTGIWALIPPLAGLALLSFLQTLAFTNPSSNPGGIGPAPWITISADPYQTRFFALLLLALTVAGVLLARHAASEKRLRIVLNLVIGVAVVSALFGIVRQTAQHSDGFGLPLLLVESGYGQFINRNHFAYLMEMGLGLILGLILGGGVKREQALIYLAALLPIWIGLVLCNSRGGLIAMVAQVIVAALLYGRVARRGQSADQQPRFLRIVRSLPARVALLLVLVAGIVVGAIWLGGDQLATRIEQSHEELPAAAAELRQGGSRNEIWQATWKLFKAHPLLGSGLGGYWAAIPAFHNASGTITPQEAHNDYLELLASGGVVGLALGAWFAVVVFKRTRENLRAQNRFRRAACYGAAIGIAGVAVHSLADFGLHTIVNALVLTTLLVIATSKPAWANERTRPQ